MPILAFPTTGRDVIGRLQKLYEDTPVDVSGSSVSKEKKRKLGTTFRNVYASIKFAMDEVGLLPRYDRTERLILKPIEPGMNGVVDGYTNERRTVMNSYEIPGTNHYLKFKDWLRGMKGDFGRYLNEKFGTPGSADESNFMTLGHEALHVQTQLRDTVTEDGEVLKPFADILFNKLYSFYHRQLKKADKWLAGYLANYSWRPLLEGANIVATENVFNGKSAYEVGNKCRRTPTTYGQFGADAADAFSEMCLKPTEEVLDFYTRPELIGRYIRQNNSTFRLPQSYLREAAA